MKTAISATDIQHTCFNSIQAQIIRKYNLSEEGYWHLEFEYGCLFVEYVIQSDQSYRNGLLMEKKNGFWNWWKYQWMLDNQQLMDASMIGIESYSELKKAMCHDGLLKKRLFDFLSI